MLSKYFRLILINKKFLKKKAFSKKNWTKNFNFNVKKFCSADYSKKKFKMRRFFSPTIPVNKFSLNFLVKNSVSEINSKKNFGKKIHATFSDENFHEKKNCKFLSVKKKNNSLLSFHHKTKINEVSIIGTELRLKIDNLLKNEIERITQTKQMEFPKKKFNTYSSKSEINYDNKKIESTLLFTNKINNRELILNINLILKLLDELFI